MSATGEEAVSTTGGRGRASASPIHREAVGCPPLGARERRGSEREGGGHQFFEQAEDDRGARALRESGRVRAGGWWGAMRGVRVG